MENIWNNNNNSLFKYFIDNENINEYIDIIRSIGGLQPKLFTYVTLLKDNIRVLSQISDITSDNSPIIPTNETFTIWRIIYTRLIPFSLIPSQKWVRDLYKAQQIFNSGWLNNFVKEDVEISDAIIALRNLRYLGCSLVNLYNFILNTNNILCNRILKTLKIYYTWIACSIILQIIINKNINDKEFTKDNAFSIYVIELNKLLPFKDMLDIGTIKWALSGIITNPSNNLSINQINELLKIAKEFGIKDDNMLLKQEIIRYYINILC